MKSLSLGGTPLAWPAAGFVAGVLLGSGVREVIVVLPMLAAAALLVTGRAGACMCVCFAAAGVPNGLALGAAGARCRGASRADAGNRILFGRVHAPRWTTDGSAFVLRADDGVEVDVWGPLSDPPRAGSEVAVYGESMPARRGRNPGDAIGPARSAVCNVESAAAVFVLDDSPSPLGFAFAVRSRLRDLLDRRYDDQAAALAQALLLGDVSNLAPEVRDAYRRLGLSHLLAISGTNISFLAVMIIAVAQVLLPRRRVAAALVAAILVAYAPVAGSSGSVVRASLMGAAAVLLVTRGRRLDPLNVLALALLLSSAWDPAAVLDPSCALSYLATLGILLYVRLIAPRAPRGARGVVVNAFGISIAASVTTLPAVAAFFGRVPLGGILYSAPGGILVGLALAPAYAGLLLAPLGPLSDLCFAAAWPALAALARIGNLELPAPALSISAELALAMTAAVAALILAGVRRGARARIGAAAIALVACVPLMVHERAPGAEVVVFDVGAGDALAIRTPDGGAWLVDTGRPGHAFMLERALRHLHIRGPTLIVTHTDDDHDGGVAELARLRVVAEVAVGFPDSASARERYDLPPRVTLRALSRGDTLWSDRGGELVCLHPARTDGDIADNPRSVVLKLRVGEESVLLTGDLEDEGEARLLARAGAGELAATVLKVPHHGSARACTDALLEAVRPSIALISCGHRPPAITAARLTRSEARTYRTDQLGALRLRLGREIAVERWCGRWVPIE